MSAETDVVAAMNASAAVLALVGADNVRDVPLRVAAPLPAITYYRVDTQATQAINGSIFELKPRITLQLHAKNPADIDALNEAVLAAALTITGSVTIADAGHDVPEAESGIKRRDVDLVVLR